ncbi:MAG: DUF1599 domain-containing protein [Candidatus Lokiarchaeota archaeon]|nr:DUF1599 domain-containing protein [Candidatus Lokiarchaeota archaeon]
MDKEKYRRWAEERESIIQNSKEEKQMSCFQSTLEEMRRIHERKNHDYSPNAEFGNFHESLRVNIPPHIGAFIRLQDKYTRICNLLSGAEQQVKDETIYDTLIDLANYAIIVYCLMRKED